MNSQTATLPPSSPMKKSAGGLIKAEKNAAGAGWVERQEKVRDADAAEFELQSTLDLLKQQWLCRPW